MTVFNAELILPVPGVKDLKSVRLTAFYDAGNVYATKGTFYSAPESFDFNTLRMSGGFSGVWLSPFGMLSVSIAQPFNDDPDLDRIQKFQFTFGSNF